MRKFLLVISILSSTGINAQSWCNQGAAWYFSAWSGISGHDALVEYKYTGDTTLQGKTCNIIKGTFSGKDVYHYGVKDTIVRNYRTYYVFMDQDVLYMMRGNGPDTLIDFNASVGDTWLVDQMCGPQKSFTVTSLMNTPYKANNYRTVNGITTFTYYNSVSSTTVTDTLGISFVDKIMCWGAWTDLFPSQCGINPSYPYDGPMTYFCGYTDQDVSLQMNNYAGCMLRTSLKEESVQNVLQMFPNPVKDKLTLELKEASVIKIYSASGTLAYETTVNEEGVQAFPTENFAQGLYLIHVRSKSGYSTGRFIKE